jgi:glycosyltransferase involved in cell wall biosynthesis
MLANRYLDRVLALCELEAQRLSSAGVRADKMEIMLAPMACPPSLELAAAARAEGRDRVLGEFDLPADRKYVGCFAQFRPVKRQDLLIRSFATLSTEFPDWDLVLAGAGPKLEECKQVAAELVPGRVRFLGSIAHERAVKLTAVMEAVAHCSTVETFGYSLLEPLLLGVPTVMTRVGVAKEIEKAGMAIVVDPGSELMLTEGLRTVFRGHLARLGKPAEASEWVRTNFDTPLVAQKLLELYERMLRARAMPAQSA